MLAGFIHPTLYLPDERISRTDAAFIFRHELTHYKHGDLWLKLLLLAARCLHWFNPLVHLIARFALLGGTLRRRATTRLFADTTARTAEPMARPSCGRLSRRRKEGFGVLLR